MAEAKGKGGPRLTPDEVTLILGYRELKNRGLGGVVVKRLRGMLEDAEREQKANWKLKHMLTMVRV
jgi:hypothetical protein